MLTNVETMEHLTERPKENPLGNICSASHRLLNGTEDCVRMNWFVFAVSDKMKSMTTHKSGETTAFSFNSSTTKYLFDMYASIL